MAEPLPHPGEAERLPRGRHGLSRAQVRAQQRGRILAAMVEACAERGYAATRVRDVISLAGVSRKTFYEQFDDREDCFLAAYDIALGVLLDVTREGFGRAPERWADQVREALRSLLATIAAEPAAARFCIIEVQAAGPRALARRDDALQEFTRLVDSGRTASAGELPELTSLAVVGGIYEYLYREILRGAAAELPERLPDLVHWVTQPFLGSDAAAEERRRTLEGG